MNSKKMSTTTLVIYIDYQVVRRDSKNSFPINNLLTACL